MLHLVFFLSAFVYAETFRIKGSSMEPTLRHNQVVKISKVSALLRRGDVVVFKIFPSRPFVKRIGAVAGDHIEFGSNQLLVNGSPLESNGVTLNFTRQDYHIIGKHLKGHVLRPGYVLVFSDNPRNSFDSRSFGAIRIDKIIGSIDWKK